MVAKVYDIMLCQDDVTRAVEIVDGSPKDPSYVNPVSYTHLTLPTILLV